MMRLWSAVTKKLGSLAGLTTSSFLCHSTWKDSSAVRVYCAVDARFSHDRRKKRSREVLLLGRNHTHKKTKCRCEAKRSSFPPCRFCSSLSFECSSYLVLQRCLISVAVDLWVSGIVICVVCPSAEAQSDVIPFLLCSDWLACFPALTWPCAVSRVTTVRCHCCCYYNT